MLSYLFSSPMFYTVVGLIGGFLAGWQAHGILLMIVDREDRDRTNEQG